MSKLDALGINEDIGFRTLELKDSNGQVTASTQVDLVRAHNQLAMIRKNYAPGTNPEQLADEMEGRILSWFEGDDDLPRLSHAYVFQIEGAIVASVEELAKKDDGSPSSQDSMESGPEPGEPMEV